MKDEQGKEMCGKHGLDQKNWTSAAKYDGDIGITVQEDWSAVEWDAREVSIECAGASIFHGPGNYTAIFSFGGSVSPCGDAFLFVSGVVWLGEWRWRND